MKDELDWKKMEHINLYIISRTFLQEAVVHFLSI